jgi:hypothetical protein
VVARALDRLAERLPVMPSEDAEWSVDARRADALVMLCSGRIARDPDPDRATVIIHARLDEAVDAPATAETEPRLHSSQIEGGPAIHPEVTRRLACTGRIQVVAESASGQPLQVSQLAREPSGWMMRQLRYRDRECTFPGCGARRFVHAHHIVWWERGGRTVLDNLVLVCPFHHKLVHEYGWGLRRDRDGEVKWFHPDGTRYRAGPGPPAQRGKRTGGQLVRQRSADRNATCQHGEG